MHPLLMSSSSVKILKLLQLLTFSRLRLVGSSILAIYVKELHWKICRLPRDGLVSRIHASGKDSSALQNMIVTVFDWEGRVAYGKETSEFHFEICISLREPMLSNACGSFTMPCTRPKKKYRSLHVNPCCCVRSCSSSATQEKSGGQLLIRNRLREQRFCSNLIPVCHKYLSS